ncbi:DUF551 domain-containing protein [Pseudomonas phage vB_PseuGesM_254]|uniref:DUF551 domain-containing protein n=1 Tax=Pseudomonas phage vB_PseuGesM_254 TaxID=3092638 RepID=A0AAX4G750_9CAUD|nr:DUF551 domain-containing protein [Pseudomonas phage PseuGes_254]
MNNQTIDGVNRSLLEKLMWVYYPESNTHRCRICERTDFEGHESECELSALLDMPTPEPLYAEQATPKPELTVWYGAMPESNGKTNWTAMLHRKDDPWGGITLDRSEYPDQVRYEADRMRYMIGEIDIEPCILDYDGELHSGYKGEQ